MFEIKNFPYRGGTNPNIKMLDQRGPMAVVEYARDMSVQPGEAVTAYYMSQMNIRKRQLRCDLSKADITLQAGAMQWMLGDVTVKTGVKGMGDFLSKMAKGSVTGESAIKPEYTGNGIVVCEPTYKHLILTNANEWAGGLVLDDGMFLACDAQLKSSIQARSNVSSAIAGGKGLFNLKLTGNGVVCLESPWPKEELVEIELSGNDVLKVDGPYVIAWSGSLDFKTERSTKSLVGSAASGEGLVNAYRGTGKLWMIPVG